MGRENPTLSDNVQVIPRLGPEMFDEVQGCQDGRTSMLRLYPRGDRRTGEATTTFVSTGILERRNDTYLERRKP
jgi:uncharacterized protein (DUF779 family)